MLRGGDAVAREVAQLWRALPCGGRRAAATMVPRRRHASSMGWGAVQLHTLRLAGRTSLFTRFAPASDSLHLCVFAAVSVHEG